MSINTQSFEYNLSSGSSEIYSPCQGPAVAPEDSAGFWDRLQTIGNAIQFFLTTLFEHNDSGKIFSKNVKVMAETRNRPKKTDLQRYTTPQEKYFDPKKFELLHASLGEKYGITRDCATKVLIRPLSGKGFCHGAALHFAYLEGSKGLQAAEEAFTGGLPYEAVLAQTICSTVEVVPHDAEMYDFLLSFVRDCPQQNKETYFRQKKGEWDALGVPDYKTAIFLATIHYLREGAKTSYLEYVQNFCEVEDFIFNDEITIRLVSQALMGYTPSRSFNRTAYSFGLFGKELESVVDNVSREEFLKNIEHLAPGRYYLRLSCSAEAGEKAQSHATVLGIGEDGSTAFFFDPNFAVYEFGREEVQDVVQTAVSIYADDEEDEPTPETKKTGVIAQIFASISHFFHPPQEKRARVLKDRFAIYRIK